MAPEMQAKTEDFFDLTTDPIDITSVARRVVPPECGATVTLDGYVRAITRQKDGTVKETLYLEYEAYEPMVTQGNGKADRAGQARLRNIKCRHSPSRRAASRSVKRA